MISYAASVIAQARMQAAGLCRRFEGCVLHAYPDPGSGGAPWTIGWGSTQIYGRRVLPDEEISQYQADAQLMADVDRALALVVGAVTVELNADQLGALASFVYNVGPGEAGVKDGFVTLKSGGPSTMLKLLNAGDFAGAAAQFALWDKADDRVLAGLVARRRAEGQLFLENSITGAGATTTALTTAKVTAQVAQRRFAEEHVFNGMLNMAGYALQKIEAL